MITQNKDVKKYFSNLNCKKLFKYKFKIFALRNKIELSMEYSYYGVFSMSFGHHKILSKQVECNLFHFTKKIIKAPRENIFSHRVKQPVNGKNRFPKPLLSVLFFLKTISK